MQNPAVATDSRTASIRAFADALVEHSDKQLAIDVANSVIRQRLAHEARRSNEEQAKVAVPPHSTFGQAWSELADALESEPFKSFAEAKLIVTSNLIIGANGELTEKVDGSIVRFFPSDDPEWSAASAAVLAAASKLAGAHHSDISFYGRAQASTSNVAGFYGLQLAPINSNDTLSIAGQLLRDGNFAALSSNNPLDAPIKQRQQDARQGVVDLPAQALKQTLEPFTPLTLEQKVKEADKALAQQVSRGLMKLVPETDQYETSVIVQDIPEYSTFNQVRKNLLTALNGAAFRTFAQDNDLDLTSVRINPVSGELTGAVRGKNTTFTLNDVSGWTDVWGEIQGAVQHMAAGSDSDVTYPTGTSAPLFEVLAFYDEAPPHQQNTRLPNWQQRQLVTTLSRVAEINQNNGFGALIDADQSNDIRQRQQAVILQLANTQAPLSQLERLAAAVRQAPDAPAQPAVEPVDTLASAETEMASAVYQMMLKLKAEPDQSSSKKMESIPSSLFDLQKTYLEKASNSLGMRDFYRKENFSARSAVWIPPSNDADRRSRASYIAGKYPEYADLLMHQDAAATPFSAHGESVSVDDANGSSVPFKWVFNFYGISTDPNSPEFTRQMELLGRTQQLPNAPENSQHIANELKRKITAVGDSNDRYALIKQLESGDISDDTQADSMRFVVDPDSSHHPKGVKKARGFLAENDGYIPKSKAESDNLIKALRTPVPNSPPLGNHWGFLSSDLPLSTEQRSTAMGHVKKSIAPQNSLLAYLGADITQLSEDPAQALEQLLATDTAHEFATRLQAQMKGAPTTTSLEQWLLTALVLELDPAAGTRRNTVAGFDFMDPTHQGLDSRALRERFTQHLIDKQQISVHLAPAVAQLLMAGSAPYLLVKDVPSTVCLGTPEWVSFVTAVNRLELTAAGASAGMTFEQVMALHRITPISSAQTRLQAIAQMNPVIDWAIVNKHLPRNENDEYTLEQLTSCQEILNKHIKETADAKNFLRNTKAPSRREMALQALREQFGTDIDYEGRHLWEKVAGGLFSGIKASICEVYEAGRLGESWSSELPGLNFEDLRAHADQLPDINKAFDAAIEQDFTLRRAHTITLFKDMLSKLPLEERNSLSFGAMEFLQVESAGSGIIMTSVHNGVRRDFAVYPAVGQIVRIPDIAPSTPLGQKVRLAIDTQAFKNGTEPRKGVMSEVVLRTNEQFILVETDDGDKRPFLREQQFGEHNQKDVPSTFVHERTDNLAKVLVDTAYLRKSTFVATQRGLHNAVENGVEPSDFFKGLLRALPGGSSLEDIYHGEYVKAVGDLAVDIIIYVATEGAGKLWRLAKTGAAWAAAKVSTRFIETFGTQAAEHIAVKDLTATTTRQSQNALSRMQSNQIVEQTADMADGRLTRSGTQEQTRITAVQQDGEWYAYDAKTEAAYGPPLQGFVSDTSSPLRQETFSDGTQALVADKHLAADAYTIPRTNGFDLVNEGKVYRYDARKPGQLTDLQSADHFKPLEGFEALCPAPSIGSGRVKREANDTCFSKVIANVTDPLRQDLQALEHVRLFPSPPKLFKKDQFVIFERRRLKVVDSEMGPRLVPTLDNKPITYNTQISGSLKHDPQFGFYGAQANNALAQDTRVVELKSISTECDDKREVRGVIVNSPVAGSADKYLVIEADTAEFYYAKLNNEPGGKLTFTKCSPNELPLVQSYRNKFSALKGPSNASFDANFIALPALDDAFAQLERANYSKEQVDELKEWCKDLTPEQQREVLYQLQRSEAIGKANIALRPTQVTALTKPADFAIWPADKQNQFYAEQAKSSVNRSMKATGLGPDNKVLSKADLKRAQAAHMTLAWLRKTAPSYAQNRSNLILKAGVGNCGEMALVSKDIITQSGGRAYEWQASDDHIFTVVGGPSELPPGTVDFAGEAWKDAWIVDPWADIACPAREYTRRIDEVMTQWARDKVRIRTGQNQFISPRDNNWLDALVSKPKTPFSHGYNRGGASNTLAIEGQTSTKPRPKPALRPSVPETSRPPVAPKVNVDMGYSHSVEDANSVLSTRSLTDCSALAVLSDFRDGVYHKRTLMHLTGSNLEFGLFDKNSYQVLEQLNKSLANGGKVIFVGGIESHSTAGMGTVLEQQYRGKKPLLDILRKPGVNTVIASSLGVEVNPDGTFKLIEGTGKGVFNQGMIKDVFDFAA
ncbi:hypothetical protein [Pseudomonas sp. L1(2025)]|uniref:hypothetical protein n=1 Tax=Pseudomonas sp. L1(2025) TaxID=3449429 RepID=UPI003F6934A3